MIITIFHLFYCAIYINPYIIIMFLHNIMLSILCFFIQNVFAIFFPFPTNILKKEREEKNIAFFLPFLLFSTTLYSLNILLLHFPLV